MAVSDRPSDEPSDGEGEGLDEEQCAWLQEQLAHIGNLHVQDDEEDEEWVDPSGGLLLNIFAACEEGALEKLTANVADLAATPHSLDTRGPDGDTALHLAALYGHADCAAHLLAAGAAADAVNPDDGTTPLHDAAAGGHEAIAAALLAAVGPGAPAARDADGDTPLHNAARGGHLRVVQLLLSAGADPCALNAAGKTPAGESDDREVTRALVAAAAARAGAGAGVAASAEQQQQQQQQLEGEQPPSQQQQQQQAAAEQD
ncbi:Espnl [Scenedesmus sp. PABB004]|nr:Espnl [Scenedesmus sp. PABB004]